MKTSCELPVPTKTALGIGNLFHAGHNILPRDDWGFPLVQIKHIRTYSVAKIFVKMQHFSDLIFLSHFPQS